MKKTVWLAAQLTGAIVLVSFTACDMHGHNQANHNTSQPAPVVATPTQAQAATGTIEVTSTPPGAQVLLIYSEQGGASEPQPRGVTPTTITVPPGKYTVDIEKPGYRFSQQVVVVKEGTTSKVNKVLRKG